MRFRSFIQLHTSVFLFGFTAILGDLIQLPLVSLVWWRVFISILFLVFLLNPLRLIRTTDRRFLWRHMFIGLLISIHWLAFYGSIKVSNASIVLIAMSTSSFITALVEPFLIRSSKWRVFDLVISVLVIPAMILIFYNASEVQQTGLWIGLLSAFVGAVFSIFNKLWIVDGEEFRIVLIQQGTVWLSLSLLLIALFVGGKASFAIPVGIDWIYLLGFSLVCTILAYFLYLRAMHWLSAFDVSFAFNMEPVYGLIMAAWILHDYEEVNFRVYLGMFFVLLMVGFHTFFKSRDQWKRLGQKLIHKRKV